MCHRTSSAVCVFDNVGLSAPYRVIFTCDFPHNTVTVLSAYSNLLLSRGFGLPLGGYMIPADPLLIDQLRVLPPCCCFRICRSSEAGFISPYALVSEQNK